MHGQGVVHGWCSRAEWQWRLLAQEPGQRCNPGNIGNCQIQGVWRQEIAVSKGRIWKRKIVLAKAIRQNYLALSCLVKRNFGNVSSDHFLPESNEIKSRVYTCILCHTLGHTPPSWLDMYPSQEKVKLKFSLNHYGSHWILSWSDLPPFLLGMPVLKGECVGLCQCHPSPCPIWEMTWLRTK